MVVDKRTVLFKKKLCQSIIESKSKMCMRTEIVYEFGTKYRSILNFDKKSVIDVFADFVLALIMSYTRILNQSLTIVIWIFISITLLLTDLSSRLNLYFAHFHSNLNTVVCFWTKGRVLNMYEHFFSRIDSVFYYFSTKNGKQNENHKIRFDSTIFLFRSALFFCNLILFLFCLCLSVWLIIWVNCALHLFETVKWNKSKAIVCALRTCACAHNFFLFIFLRLVCT